MQEPNPENLLKVSVFKELVAKVDIEKEIEEAGNVTIFSPFNNAFDKLPMKVEDMDLPTLRKIILKLL